MRLQFGYVWLYAYSQGGLNVALEAPADKIKYMIPERIAFVHDSATNTINVYADGSFLKVFQA